ncbi:MAG: hypothetical protein JST49_14260 [Bacteroidetes bacterium]|nr:hypothetical protein [Bacteroidota bacterium]
MHNLFFFLHQYRLSLIWLCLLVLTFFIYLPSNNSLLIDDGIAGLVDFEKQGYSGFINSFNFPSLYYMHDIAMLLIYAIVGKSSFGWFMIMIFMHFINASLAYILFKSLYTAFSIKYAKHIALAGAALFLLSPYQTENVLWAATIHYSIALTFLLVSGLIILRQLNNNKLTFCSVLLISLLHIAAITSLEIALVFPAIYFVIAVFVLRIGKNVITIWQFCLKILLPLTLITILYFAFTAVLKGMLIPHYGSEHIANLSYANYIINTAKHTLKLFSYAHFANYQWREIAYTFCERWKVISLLLFLLATVGGVTVYYRFKKNGIALYVLLLLCAFILLFPVLNMYFMYLFTPENDRLSYFYSLFLYQLLAIVFISASWRWGIGIILLFGCVGIFFLIQTVNKWHEAGAVHTNLINSFAWGNQPKVYVLNQPNNYKGVYEFRTNRRLSRALFFFKGIEIGDSITHVLSSAQANLHDSTLVSILNDSTLQVDFISNGGWLMHERVGASNYSTPEYSVTVDPWKPSYQVVFHNKRKDAAYIYATDNVFKKLEGF